MIRFLCVFVALVFPMLAMAGAWDSTYEGAAGVHGPITSSTSVALAPDHMRNARQEIRYRLEVEHFVGDGDGTADDNGLHRLGSARCFMSDDPPDELDDSHSAATDTIYDYLNSTGASDSGVEDLEDSASNSAGGAEDDVGHGRCWIDTNDNYRMYIYVGQASDDTPSTATDGWVPINAANSPNLITHGGFEGTDGDGDLSSTTVPYAWTDKNTPTYAYLDITGSPFGSGYQLRTTNNPTADSGITQTLSGLNKDSWYIFSVLAGATTGNDCQLNVSGATRTVPSAGEVSVTDDSVNRVITVLALTDSSATDLVMTLQGVGTSDVCYWDHAEVHAAQGVQQTGATIFKASNASTTACGTAYTSNCTNIVSITVTPPGPGYTMMLQGKAIMNGVDADTCSLELWDDTNSAQLDESYFISDTNANDQNYLHVNYMSNVLLAGGASTTYTLNAKEVTNCVLVGYNSIEAILIPNGG